MTKQSDIEMVAKARAWAVKAHAGQKDKAGKNYFKAHVTVVAEGVKGDPIAEAVAFLHDAVEDTSVTIEDIRTGFPKEVADAVSTLTHSKGISYAEYLWYIQQNSIAMEFEKPIKRPISLKAFASGIRCSITGRNVLFRDAGHRDISL